MGQWNRRGNWTFISSVGKTVERRKQIAAEAPDHVLDRASIRVLGLYHMANPPSGSDRSQRSQAVTKLNGWIEPAVGQRITPPRG